MQIILAGPLSQKPWSPLSFFLSHTSHSISQHLLFTSAANYFSIQSLSLSLYCPSLQIKPSLSVAWREELSVHPAFHCLPQTCPPVSLRNELSEKWSDLIIPILKSLRLVFSSWETPSKVIQIIQVFQLQNNTVD